jgi:uracil-DNA glycosylase family 4
MASRVEQNRATARACADLASLRASVAQCTACALHRTRTQTVFSDGTGKARVMFVGEAPGQHEDEQGVPFVGRAGALLSDIVTKGMGLDRRDVYIANVLKCRPPGNRDPLPEEKELCTPFLDRQIELVAPEVVITLGLHAAHHVLRTQSSPQTSPQTPMGKLRGVVHRVGGRRVIATYHPAFLLRAPEMKKECWKDIQLAMRELGLAPPRSQAPAVSDEGPGSAAETGNREALPR